MMNGEQRMMNDEWRVMNDDEWWMINDEWRASKQLDMNSTTKQPLNIFV